MESKKGEFIFIGGTGRSGTTILSKVLNTHKEFNRLPFEFRFHIDPNGLYDLFRNLNDNWDVYRGSTAVAAFKAFYFKLLGTSLHSYHHITLKSNSKAYYQNILEDFFKELEIIQERRLWIGNSPFLPKSISMFNPKMAKTTYPKFYLTRYTEKEKFYKSSETFLKKIFSTELERSDYLLEHTPYNFLYFDFLNNVFPNSKFIHIKRNPLDVISSYSTQNWGSEDINYNSKQIIDLYKKWESNKTLLNNYLEISLEELGENTDSTLKKIADYLETDAGEFKADSIDADKLHLNRWKEKEEYFKKLPVFSELKKCAENLGYGIY